MAREDLHFRLRIPEGLKGRIEDQAEANNRSMTAEIVARLEQSFHPSEELAKSELIRGVQAELLESNARENEYLKKIHILNDRLILELARAISLASKGDRDELERLIEQEKTAPTLSRMVVAQLGEG